MSAGPDSNMINTIYISLLHEGVNVIRPTTGSLLPDGSYLVLPTPDYDPEAEEWEFLPGTVVNCKAEVISDEEVLVARSLRHPI